MPAPLRRPATIVSGWYSYLRLREDLAPLAPGFSEDAVTCIDHHLHVTKDGVEGSRIPNGALDQVQKHMRFILEEPEPLEIEHVPLTP